MVEELGGNLGEACMAYRPMKYLEVEGSKSLFTNGNTRFELGFFKSPALELISFGKCQALDKETWRWQSKRK